MISTSRNKLKYKLQRKRERKKRTLTVFDEDVHRLFGQTVFHDVLVGLHHVGAEDFLVAALSHVGSGRSSVAFQQVGAASLRWEHKLMITFFSLSLSSKGPCFWL